MLINSVVIVSGGQQSDAVIHLHASILPQTPLPSRLPHNIEQSCLCYTVCPCWSCIHLHFRAGTQSSTMLTCIGMHHNALIKSHSSQSECI